MFCVRVKDPLLSIMLHAPVLFCFARDRDFYCFPGFAFLAWKGNISSRTFVLFKLIKEHFLVFPDK